ncbi:hypothetical protein DN402_04860 [Streptomyces sp. SW4]|nr:hypothetical protein DN402_04860 [Streptomyces sp. SW4]
MQELLGRLTALDPEAGESLKVVSYFDTLVTAGAGLDALLRGAAALSGAVAGADRRGRISRRAPDGREPQTEPQARSPQRTCSVGSVWLERAGALHANDEMIVERLALSLDLIEARRSPVSDLEIVIDPARTAAERTTALAKLHLVPGSRIRIVATRPDTPATTAASAVVPPGTGSYGRPCAAPSRSPVTARGARPVGTSRPGARLLGRRRDRAAAHRHVGPRRRRDRPGRSAAARPGARPAGAARGHPGARPPGRPLHAGAAGTGRSGQSPVRGRPARHAPLHPPGPARRTDA